MPLRAELQGETLFSHKMSPAEWDKLKKSDSNKLLTLPCCNQRAVVKTSPLGTQFFAHYRKSEDCISQPESKEHLRLKAIVSAAAESAGWTVTTEYMGHSKNGDKWIADVYCTKGKAKVALEIQLSPQTAKELKVRHKRYFDSGVRAAWFMKDSVYVNSGHCSIQAFPRFQIKHFMDDRSTPQMADYPLSVADFVKTLLTGGLVWKEDKDSTLLYYMESNCWKCKVKLHIPIGMGDTMNSNFDNYIKTVPNCSTFYSDLVAEIGNDGLKSLGLTAIGAHPNMKGNAPKFPYCVECNNCGAPQSNCYTLENYHDWARKAEEDRCSIVLSTYSHSGRYELAPLSKDK
ncbi:competence protein CoiA family protein [Alkalimonas sp. MEB108]|uniref:Competence protein CoiA family protein n=1 Tax=Alkalimonas cellulosilytica TaxID=3058395 RepID=A0ABU7J563_9GAMM|nr:competence protein CoiA family protein [Alkalimonas sp. MEB108]MEE2001644.1 competence protein CoiA family protein [Alkalimonas sp. MEB108]